MSKLTRIFTICAFWCFAGLAHAQTPTPHPNALTPGYYNFEDLSSPEIELTGAGWSVSTFRNVTGLNNASSGDTLTFWVLANAHYLTIYRRTFDNNTNDGEWTICVNTTGCTDVIDYHGVGLDPVLIPLSGTNSEIVITHTNTRDTLFDAMTIALDPASIVTGVVSGTSPSPTATPDPAIIYGTVTGVSGTVTTRFDMRVTAGDVSNVSALLFLGFSLWAIVLLVLFMSRKNV